MQQYFQTLGKGVPTNSHDSFSGQTSFVKMKSLATALYTNFYCYKHPIQEQKFENMLLDHGIDPTFSQRTSSPCGTKFLPSSFFAMACKCSTEKKRKFMSVAKRLKRFRKIVKPLYRKKWGPLV